MKRQVHILYEMQMSPFIQKLRQDQNVMIAMKTNMKFVEVTLYDYIKCLPWLDIELYIKLSCAKITGLVLL